MDRKAVESKRNAEDNFNNIDRNIKTLLKRDVSLGYVEKYESKLVEDFLTSTKERHLVDDVPCSFERMILHGICQYYDLESRSKLLGVFSPMELQIRWFNVFGCERFGEQE